MILISAIKKSGTASHCCRQRGTAAYQKEFVGKFAIRRHSSIGIFDWSLIVWGDCLEENRVEVISGKIKEISE
jgi:hypothetical protein